MSITRSRIIGECVTNEEKINQCREYFKQILEYEEPCRTKYLVELMNIMEREFKVFAINPTGEFMAKEEVVLYREISEARNFDI